MPSGEPQAADNPSWMSSPTNDRRSGGKARQTVPLRATNPVSRQFHWLWPALTARGKNRGKIGPIRGLVARSGTVWPPLRTWRGVQQQNVLFPVVAGVQHVTTDPALAGLSDTHPGHGVGAYGMSE